MGAVVDFADESKNRIRVKNNVELAISLGKSRNETNWKKGSKIWKTYAMVLTLTSRHWKK